ncbi:MAG: MATE family efflux transporter [Anaerorhabdus sp.]
MKEIKRNKMATMPVGKLLMSMSLPAMFSMLIQSLYNIVDTIYISRVSEEAVFTMTIVFPMQIILISLALGGAIGTSTIIARRLGQNDHEEANKTASTGFLLAIFHTILCCIFGFLIIEPFLKLFTSDAAIIEMGKSYLSIVMTFSFGIYLGIYFERLLQSQGNTIIPMCSLIVGALSNIILDPIFIFGFGFIPAMGIKGAAIATVAGQIMGMLFIAAWSTIGKHEVKIQFKGLHLKWERIKEIYAIGLPVTIMNAIGAFANMAVNAVVVSYSAVAVSSLGLYFKLSSFVFMPVFGLNQGSLPILSFNYGAQDEERYTSVLKKYLISVIVIMGCGTILFWLQTDFLISFFSVSDSLRASTREVLRIISLSFIGFGICIFLITVFQSFGNALVGMVISILRQIVFLVPLVYILGRLFGIDAVWYAYLIAECLVVALFVPRCYKTYKNAFKGVKNV